MSFTTAKAQPLGSPLRRSQNFDDWETRQNVTAHNVRHRRAQDFRCLVTSVPKRVQAGTSYSDDDGLLEQNLRLKGQGTGRPKRRAQPTFQSTLSERCAAARVM